MSVRYHMMCLVGAVGLLLVAMSGCNKKALDASVSGKAYLPPPKSAGTGPAGAQGSEGTGSGLTEQNLPSGGTDAGGPPPDAGFGGGAGMGAGTGGDSGVGGGMADLLPPPGAREDRGGAGGSLSPSFPPLTPSGKGGGDDRGAGDIIVAKAEPSDAARRQMEQMQQEQLATALAGLSDVFFNYDSWKLSEEAMRAIEGDANWLKSNPGKTLMIEGYCDERGTVAYNLVLGERRAKAVRNYLIELGVDPARLTVVSYGKERPFCKDHDESCYKLNRRAHLVLRVQ